KQPVRTITSNAGHALWSHIADRDKAVRVADRLLSPRAGLSSGWGVRTVAAGQRPYDPIGYHRGTGWPHDNALIAHGLRGYEIEIRGMRIGNTRLDLRFTGRDGVTAVQVPRKSRDDFEILIRQ